MTNTGLPSGQKLQASIQWDDVIYGYSRRGRQSEFEAACYWQFHPITGDAVDMDHEDDPRVPPCHVKRRGLISAMATGDRTNVIGGVSRRDLRPPKYSAGGPASPVRGGNRNRVGPDALSVSDNSRVHTGVLGAGSRSGSTVVMNGTSVAAPQITKIVADMLAAGGRRDRGDRAAVRRLAVTRQGTLPNAPPRPSNERGGAGRIIGSGPIGRAGRNRMPDLNAGRHRRPPWCDSL